MDGNTPLVGLNIYRFGACSYRGGRLLIFSCFLHIPTHVGRWRTCLGELFSFVFTQLPLTHTLFFLLFFFFNKFIMDGFMKIYD
jgi:hypothetical protein